MSGNTLTGTWVSAPLGRIAAPLREQVIAALRNAILDFHLAPGQRLIERELTEMLGVSRTTVREAIRELSSEGLVTVIPHKGTVVSAPSHDDAADLYEIRASLESLLVKRFVERASASQVLRLEAAVENYAEVASQTQDLRIALGAKDIVYEVLMEGAKSGALREQIEGIQARVRILRATSLSEPRRALEAADELRGVVEAVKLHDADLAAQRCADHVRSAARTALRALEKTEV